MTSATVRITHQALEKVRLISAMTGQKQQEVVDNAVETYRRRLFLELANESFACMRSDKNASAQETAERAVWDCTLEDGQEGRQIRAGITR